MVEGILTHYNYGTYFKMIPSNLSCPSTDVFICSEEICFCITHIFQHRAAQFEHEVLITETGAEVITVPE